MEWQDEGFILHTQALGEHKKVVSLFTKTHGRYSGLFSGGKKIRSCLQCGGKVKAGWRARLDNHLGHWTFEPLSGNTAFLLDAPGPLAALVSAAAICQLALPERHAYPALYERFDALLKDLHSPFWLRSYIFFELSLLTELGYGLNLTTCAVTGVTTDLFAVSPRTGRAVCKEIAMPYLDRLLPLPQFTWQDNTESMPEKKEMLEALHLTGYFLTRNLLGRSLPPARERLKNQVDRFTSQPQ